MLWRERSDCGAIQKLRWLDLLVAAPLTLAQENLEPLPAVPPPPPEMEAFDASLEAAHQQAEVTIRQDERGTVQEYRLRGKLYMTKIVPAVGAPYYLVDTDGDGALETRYNDGNSVSVPMWLIGTF